MGNMDILVDHFNMNTSWYTPHSSVEPTNHTPMGSVIDLQETDHFMRQYSQYHGYISAVICVFGVVSNILNIIVLMQRHMITPTNYILIALAISDVLTMSFYLVYAIYFYCYAIPFTNYGHSEGWIYFVCINILVVITCHNMAMWLTVSLAVFRYIFVCHHVVANQLCSLQRAKITIAIVMITTIITCTPNYFLYKVVDMKIVNNGTGYWVMQSDFASNNIYFQPITFWIYGVIIKIAPCVLLVILSACIIYKMNEASKRRQRLLQQSGRHNEEALAEHNRTTMMLVAVVLFFVLTEFPQGILAAISGLNETFFQNVYSNLGDIMDLLVLINSAINFILYCIMSKQFRDTFKNLFVCKLQKVRNHNSHTSRQNGTPSYYNVKTDCTQV
ncbi:G-protein coupled receptor dmsr-1-like [Argopecten irradians]|uniref:G-protein coupled receptor dmsr-1-like n=1 Tax=Argopecten irradians TaxID=31199 RepID=UPI003718C4F8